MNKLFLITTVDDNGVNKDLIVVAEDPIQAVRLLLDHHEIEPDGLEWTDEESIFEGARVFEIPTDLTKTKALDWGSLTTTIVMPAELQEAA